MPWICRKQGEVLPEGWKAIEVLTNGWKTRQDLHEGWKASQDLQQQVSSFKHYLNDMKTLAKLTKQAVLSPMVNNMTNDNSVSL